MIKEIIGMIRWKSRMKKLQKQEPYTDEWWNEVIDSLEFLPKEAREGFVESFVGTTLQG